MPRDFRDGGTFVVDIESCGGERMLCKDGHEWSKPSGSSRFVILLNLLFAGFLSLRNIFERQLPSPFTFASFVFYFLRLASLLIFYSYFESLLFLVPEAVWKDSGNDKDSRFPEIVLLKLGFPFYPI